MPPRSAALLPGRTQARPNSQAPRRSVAGVYLYVSVSASCGGIFKCVCPPRHLLSAARNRTALQMCPQRRPGLIVIFLQSLGEVAPAAAVVVKAGLRGGHTAQ